MNSGHTGAVDFHHSELARPGVKQRMTSSHGLSEESSEITNRLCPVQKAENQGNLSHLTISYHRKSILSWGVLLFCLET